MNDPFSKGKADMTHMQRQLTNRMDSAIRRNMGKAILILTPIMLSVLSGCVQVTAPDKPIVINLNIAVRQEILLKLSAASEKVIEENPEIF
ncbi:MAG TPA: YnbE family lipoprotein [Sphingorhabdus lacus]|nr:YnbE family lipoprotein [Sphingorhabdus lacus]HPV67835.1 YnbE family lipoprotein [Sphingorhabdus lacus]